MTDFRLSIVFLMLGIAITVTAQSLQDDFEGNGNITAWVGDNCGADASFPNPFQLGNTSATVLQYRDVGGQYANIRFDAPSNFDLSAQFVFSLKVYVSSDEVEGNQPNQVSLKLQNNNLGQPWTTQCEVIKPIVLNQWQTVTFDFVNDSYVNLDGSSPPPIQRTDFNRVLLQVNGENNNDAVTAYFDDFEYTVTPGPVYDYLVWSDECDGEGVIDTDKWFHQTQLPNSGSWFNNEIQHYTNRIENAFLEGGSMRIMAKKETYTDQGYTKSHTSARLNSKFAFQYGRVEVRAKLPTGGGTWPAIWTLGQNITEAGAYWQTQGYATTGWPFCGELDIMEHWGSNQDYVSSAIHTPSSHGATVNYGGRTLEGASEDFHVYAMEWTPDRVTFSVDDAVHYVYAPTVKNAETWPFDAPQYILLNVAILPHISSDFVKSSMDIDYVRVYQENPVSDVSAPSPAPVKYYPNPVRDRLNIQLYDYTAPSIQLQLYDQGGRLLQRWERPVAVGQTSIDSLQHLNGGIYTITYTSDGTLQSFQFIKQ